MITDNENLEAQIADYVLGVLQGDELMEFERTMKADPAIQREVEAWQENLQPLAEDIPSVAPPAAVWDDIQERLGFAEEPVQKSSFWERINFWRSLSIASTAAALFLAVVILRVTPAADPAFVYVVQENNAVEWVVKASANGQLIKVNAITPPEMPAGKVCDLWLTSADGQVYSIGRLPMSGVKEFQVPSDARGSGMRVTVSVEDESNTLKTGPSEQIVSSGKWIAI